MIAKIVQGRGFKGVVNYVLDKNKAELLAADGLRLKDKDSIIRSFITQSSLNPIAKPVAHISLDFSVQDKGGLTNRKMVEIAQEYMAKMGYGNTQFLIARHHDTDHPHLHLILNRVDTDGKRISDQNERIRSTQVCKELTVKHGLYFAKGKENVKRHRLREPDKAKYEIYDAVKVALPKANNWQELAAILAKEGIAIEFKRKGKTSQIEGVKFTKNGYTFSGSKVDRQFSYSKIDFVLRQNSREEQRQEQPQAQSPKVRQSNPSPPKEVDFSGGGIGLFDDLLTANPANDAEEDEFRRRMQRKKKKKRGFGL